MNTTQTRYIRNSPHRIKSYDDVSNPSKLLSSKKNSRSLHAALDIVEAIMGNPETEHSTRWLMAIAGTRSVDTINTLVETLVNSHIIQTDNYYCVEKGIGKTYTITPHFETLSEEYDIDLQMKYTVGLRKTNKEKIADGEMGTYLKSFDPEFHKKNMTTTPKNQELATDEECIAYLAQYDNEDFMPDFWEGYDEPKEKISYNDERTIMVLLDVSREFVRNCIKATDKLPEKERLEEIVEVERDLAYYQAVKRREIIPFKDVKGNMGNTIKRLKRALG